MSEQFSPEERRRLRKVLPAFETMVDGLTVDECRRLSEALPAIEKLVSADEFRREFWRIVLWWAGGIIGLFSAIALLQENLSALFTWFGAHIR